ncbi:MAG: hypothetical protein JXR95_00965 [Deltaproteobacteria bacterium]|nr:hypothetical protein [Deltaproteobacteria bacterium]
MAKISGNIFKHTGILISWLAISAGASYSYNSYIFNYIKTESTSTSRDFFLRLGFYFGILMISIPLSLLFDKYGNSGRFINKITGARIKTDDFLTRAQQVKSGQAQFYIFFLIAAIGNWWIFDSLGGNFNSWYRKYGQYYTSLRSSDENARIKAIKRLSSYHEDSVMKLIANRINQGSPREILMSVWLSGKNSLTHHEIISAIKKRSTDRDLKLKNASILALARLTENPPIDTVRFIEEELKKYLSTGKVPPESLIFAAAFLRTSEFLNIYRDFFKLKDDRLKVILTYAMVWIRGMTPEQLSKTVRQLKYNLKKGSNRLKCMTTVAMAFLSENLDDESLAILRREFEAKSSEFKCSPEIFSLHPEGAKEDTINITRLSIRGFTYPAHGNVRYRERVLRVLALNRDDSMIPWFKRMAENDNLGKYLKNLAKQAAKRKTGNNQIVDW